MKKQFLLKFEEELPYEFSQWMKGKKFQVKYLRDTEPEWWNEEKSKADSGMDNIEHIIHEEIKREEYLIVLDDDFVEFRKALAEGKQIQFNQDRFQCLLEVSNEEGWIDLPSASWNEYSIFDRGDASYYRVKPEPQILDLSKHDQSIKAGDIAVVFNVKKSVCFKKPHNIKKINFKSNGVEWNEENYLPFSSDSKLVKIQNVPFSTITTYEQMYEKVRLSEYDSLINRGYGHEKSTLESNIYAIRNAWKEWKTVCKM